MTDKCLWVGACCPDASWVGSWVETACALEEREGICGFGLSLAPVGRVPFPFVRVPSAAGAAVLTVAVHVRRVRLFYSAFVGVPPPI